MGMSTDNVGSWIMRLFGCVLSGVLQLRISASMTLRVAARDDVTVKFSMFNDRVFKVGLTEKREPVAWGSMTFDERLKQSMPKVAVGVDLDTVQQVRREEMMICR